MVPVKDLWLYIKETTKKQTSLGSCHFFTRKILSTADNILRNKKTPTTTRRYFTSTGDMLQINPELPSTTNRKAEQTTTKFSLFHPFKL